MKGDLIIIHGLVDTSGLTSIHGLLEAVVLVAPGQYKINSYAADTETRTANI